ncbi:Crp/Fnr family transcriptional regulator [Thiococcus pfennigii]|uniref:Crp/Fnr family transcriptional regulator n=1 Tax=Thiococcus pfennigii TaxID=1057 RepID=UPI001904F7E5|nr:Crp/Fnr family transcriptional regulator [Thiococcus pfennigii]MBK1732303.1 hypothetical protein [Thiococcus pfennigii]
MLDLAQLARYGENLVWLTDRYCWDSAAPGVQESRYPSASTSRDRTHCVLDDHVFDGGAVPNFQAGASTNLLLATLCREDHGCLLTGLEQVRLHIGEVLLEPGVFIRSIYFPDDDLLISLLTLNGSNSHNSRKRVEVAQVGSEGMVGLPLAFGSRRSIHRAVVQTTGTAMTMEWPHFRAAVDAYPALQHALGRYAHALIAQISQSVCCSQFHQVEGRLAQWLLLASARLHSNSLHFTHDGLANLLGVRRVGITQAAGNLQQRGLIQYRHGDIQLLDRQGLQASACECHEKVKDILEELGGRGRMG